MAPADARDRRTDVLVAAGTAVVSLGLLVGLPPLDAVDPDSLHTSWPPVGGAAWSVTAAGLLAQSFALLAARRAPRTTLLVTAGLAVVVAVLASTSLFGLTSLPVAVAVVLAGLRQPVARLWPALVGTAVLVAAAQTAASTLSPSAVPGGAGQGVLQAVGAVGIPLLVVLVVRSRRDVRAARLAEASARTAEATAVDREQDARLEAAIARERSAMARELHDIAAHHLSGIALMSAVIDRQIDADPDRAHEGVRQVREQSTAVLEDLRRLVGLLREDSPAERTVETVAGIVDLVERARYRTPVDLDVHPGDRPLADGVGPLAQLAVYRTVQEALANVALHAPGAVCTVVVDDTADDHLAVRVDNGPATAPSVGSTPAGGNGLRGMRERADLVGARLQTGPTEAGGWSVVLTVGREAQPASDTSPADGGPGSRPTSAPSDDGVAR